MVRNKGKTVLIFLDTEFTDFIDCELISIGMVSEDGQHEFYAERTDYDKCICSDFVLEAVVPHLGKSSGAACTREELTQRLWQWFATLPGKVQIATESTHDRDLLWDALSEGLPENLDSSIYDLRPLFDEATFNEAEYDYHADSDRPWHHALHDAKAHRAGWAARKNLEPASRPYQTLAIFWKGCRFGMLGYPLSNEAGGG